MWLFFLSESPGFFFSKKIILFVFINWRYNTKLDIISGLRLCSCLTMVNMSTSSSCCSCCMALYTAQNTPHPVAPSLKWTFSYWMFATHSTHYTQFVQRMDYQMIYITFVLKYYLDNTVILCSWSTFSSRLTDFTTSNRTSTLLGKLSFIPHVTTS